MFGFTGLALGENRPMLDHPELIGRPLVTFIGVRPHGPPDTFVFGQTQAPQMQAVGHGSGRIG